MCGTNIKTKLSIKKADYYSNHSNEPIKMIGIVPIGIHR